jgi:hypothetical protein
MFVRKRRLILVLGLCALGVVPCQGWQNHPADRDLDRDREMGGAFAFANRSGTELLVTDENASGNNDVVKTFSKAVCPGNKVFVVRFVAHQSSGKQDSGRATSRNFENVAGSRFHILEGRVKADEQCLLANQTYIKDKRVLPMKVAVRQDQPASALRCDARTQGGLGRQQGRSPIDCWQLAEIGRDGRLLAVLYEPRRKDLLAALVLEVGDKHFVYEMPAQSDPVSSWSEGDGGKFDPKTLGPLFVLEDNRDGSWDVGISIAGEEGANLSAYRSTSAATLKKVVSGYVYWYPAS